VTRALRLSLPVSNESAKNTAHQVPKDEQACCKTQKILIFSLKVGKAFMKMFLKRASALVFS
jgi:hypothetical protein